jgi:hypothetical protein
MYLYRTTQKDALVPHIPETHGYPCDYIGGDGGPTVEAEDYHLCLDRGEQVIFLNSRTGKYHAAVRVGEPSMFPCGVDWRQEQAHIMRAYEVSQSPRGEFTALVGPFSFYNLLYVLSAGAVTPREAIAAGYIGEAVKSMRGHVRDLACETLEEALALLALL